MLPSGVECRADGGVEVWGPGGTEAAGDLAEGGRGADVALGAVVGGRHLAFGHEDEEPVAVLAVAFSQPLGMLVGGLAGHDLVEAAFQVGGVGSEGGVLEVASSAARAQACSSSRFIAGAKILSPASMAYWRSRS